MKFSKFLLISLLCLATLDTFAQSSAELKRRKDKLTSEIESLNQSLRETANSKKGTLRQLNLIKAQISLREKKINTINSEIRNLDNQITDNNNNIRSLQGQLDQLKKDYAAMVLFAFRNQSAHNKLMFIFAAQDFNQAYKRLKYLQQFGTYRQRQAEYIQGTQKELSNKIAELDKYKKEKSTLLQDEEKEKATLGKQRNTQNQVVSQLSKKEKQTQQEIAKKNQEAARLNRAISAAVRREIEKAEAEAKAAAAKANPNAKPETNTAKKPIPKGNSDILAATPEAAKLSNDFLGNRGRLPWPVTHGIIIGQFGSSTIQGVPVDNDGIDIKTQAGAPVQAVFEGEVSQVQNLGGTFLVIVRHGQYFTMYSNLKSASVSRGQKVAYKQSVGIAGVDAVSGDTIVHFELWKGLAPQNPNAWIASN
jgi:septal ring factor EnvC (AmiA/AmiB activator)